MRNFFSNLWSIILLLVFSVIAKADYATPGSGVHFTPDSLVANSQGAVTGGSGYYMIVESLIISNNDTLTLNLGDTLEFGGVSGALSMEVNGALFALGSEQDSIIITSQNKDYGDYEGIEFRDTNPASAFQLRYCRIEYAERALRIVGADGLVEHCRIQHTGEAAIDLSSSNSIIRENMIHHNQNWALKMTLSSSPLVENNLFTENNFENSSPYVIVTVGLQGTNSPTIRGNTIIGQYEMSGGISIWGNSNAVIENNHIENCAYGILCYQSGANPMIRKNTLINNNINPGTDWGFAIACNGSNAPVITGNQMAGNFYGVAIINGAQPNVGNLNNADTTDDGRNQFLGNFYNGNQYELFNNNPLPIFAENNWWGTNDPDSIEARIVHSVDSTAYGTVDFIPFITNPPVMIAPPVEPVPEVFTVYRAFPNPFNSSTTIRFALHRQSLLSVALYDISGRRVKTLLNKQLLPGEHAVQWNGTGEDGQAVSSGMYLYHIFGEGQEWSGKLLLIK